MAIRHKTVVFAFPSTTVVSGDASNINLTQISATIPEIGAAGTSIVACWAEVSFFDVVTATGGTITEHRVGLSIGGAAYTTFTETDDLTNSGENLAGVIGPIDFTAHAQANWTLPTRTVNLQVYFDQNTGTTLGMANVAGLLYVTYAYDDDPAVNPVQLRTAIMPLESLTGALSTVATATYDSIPSLSSTICPEAIQSSVDWFVVIEGNESNNNATTDWTLNVSVAGETITYATQEAALGSDRYGRWVFKPSSIPSLAQQTLQMWCTGVGRLNHCAVCVYYTYTFNAATTTRCGTTLLIPVEIASPLGGTVAANASRFQRSISVQEGNPTLEQSAFRINFNASAAVAGLNWRAGSQAFRAYTHAANVACGMYCLQRRIDSGAVGGAGFALARGMNTITIDGYQTDTTDQATNISGYILLNYTFDKPAAGVGAANHTVRLPLYAWNAQLQDRVRVNGYSFPIPEGDYWIVSSGFHLTQHGSASNALTFDTECLSGEGKGGGYYDIYADVLQTDAERGFFETWMRGRDVFKRFPADFDPDRLDIETARAYRLMTANTTGYGMEAVVTYHSQTWTVAGNITGNNPALTTEVRLVYAATGEIRQEQTLAAGVTAFSFTVHDNTEGYFVSARQDGTHVGRSDTGTAV